MRERGQGRVEEMDGNQEARTKRTAASGRRTE
jgi:hypothetical protein